MEVEVKYNQSLIDVAIEHLGSAELALDIALLNGISLTDVLVPGTSLLLPEVKPQSNTEALPVVATVTEASLLQLLTAHTAILGGAVAGHVRNGGNVRVDPEGRMWVTFPDYVTNWDDIEGVPSSFPPSAHTHESYQLKSEKNTVGGYPGIDQGTQKILPQWLPAMEQRKELRLKQHISLPSYTLSCISVRQNAESIKIAIVGTDITKINNYDFNYDRIGNITSLSTAGASISEYIPTLDEFWIIQSTGTLIYRINASTNTLIGTITIPSAVAARNCIVYHNNYVYTSTSMCSILRINTTTLAQDVKYINDSSIRTIYAFTHRSIDYVYFTSNIAGGVLDPNMNFITIPYYVTNVFSGIFYKNNKLVIGNNGLGGCYSIDLTNWPENVSVIPTKNESLNFFDVRKYDDDSMIMLSRYGLPNCLYISTMTRLLSTSNDSLSPAYINQFYPNSHLCVHESTKLVIVANRYSFISLTFYKYE